MARIPSGRAHSISSVRMCSALGRAGGDVVLVAPRWGINRAGFTEFYGISPMFRLLRILVPRVLKGEVATQARLWMMMSIIYAFQAGLLACIASLASRDRRLYLFITEPSLLLAIFLLHPRPAVIYELHDIPRLKGLTGTLMKAALSRCSLIITTSEYQKRILEPVVEGRVPVLPAHNVAEEELFNDEGAIEGGADTELQLPPEARIVLYAGQLSAWKRPEFIVEAVKMLGRQDVHLVFVGGDERDIARVKAYASLLGLANVSFTGFVRPRLVPKLLRRADVLVHYTPPPREGSIAGFSPLKIFEYMLAGKPIVAPRTPGVVEVLRDGYNALLFNPHDPRDMASKIRLIIDDEDLAKRISVNAQLEASGKYTYRARAAKILEKLSELS